MNFVRFNMLQHTATHCNIQSSGQLITINVQDPSELLAEILEFLLSPDELDSTVEPETSE